MKTNSSLLRSIILDVRNTRSLPSEEEIKALSKQELLRLESDQAKIISTFKSESVFKLMSMRKRLISLLNNLNDIEDNQKHPVAKKQAAPIKKQKQSTMTKKQSISNQEDLSKPSSSLPIIESRDKPDFQKIIDHINEIEEMLKNGFLKIK